MENIRGKIFLFKAIHDQFLATRGSQINWQTSLWLKSLLAYASRQHRETSPIGVRFVFASACKSSHPCSLSFGLVTAIQCQKYTAIYSAFFSILSPTFAIWYWVCIVQYYLLKIAGLIGMLKLNDRCHKHTKLAKWDYIMIKSLVLTRKTFWYFWNNCHMMEI